jgi:hypothetical protein
VLGDNGTLAIIGPSSVAEKRHYRYFIVATAILRCCISGWWRLPSGRLASCEADKWASCGVGELRSWGMID